MTSDPSSSGVSQASHFKAACISNVWVKSSHFPIFPSYRKLKNQSSVGLQSIVASFQTERDANLADLEKACRDSERDRETIRRHEQTHEANIDMIKKLQEDVNQLAFSKDEAERKLLEAQEMLEKDGLAASAPCETQEQYDHILKKVYVWEDIMHRFEAESKVEPVSTGRKRSGEPDAGSRKRRREEHKSQPNEGQSPQDRLDSSSRRTEPPVPQDRWEYNGVHICTTMHVYHIYIYIHIHMIIHVYDEIIIAWCGVAQTRALCYGLLCGLGIVLWIAGGSCTKDKRSMCVSCSSQGPNIHVFGFV